jgi:hypothetical protein
LTVDSEEYRRGWREAQVLARQIFLTSGSPVEARGRIRRLKRRLIEISRFH